MKHTRRKAIGAMVAGAVTLGGFHQAIADIGSQLPETSQDGFRSGPLGPSDAVQTLASERPVAMIIPEANVDSEVEVNQIVEGQMLNPTGPWVVSWYEGTGLLHEKRRNMLYSGHVDYWDVGPAIFWNLVGVPEGTRILVLGDRGGEATYAIEYIERVTLAEMTPEKMREITAPTPYEALTIITCGGEFDYNVGQYLQRDIVRARLVHGQESGTRITVEESAAPEEESVVAEEAPADPVGDAAGEAPATAGTGTVTQDGVNVRSEPSTTGSPLTAVNNGDRVTVTGENVEGDGFTWYPVQLDDGTEGYIVDEYLDID
jgi:uncharacterized protein YgiM (DUF1202 family)